MSAYQEASQLKAQLNRLINEAIENHPTIKATIKAKKATVESVDTSTKTVVVRLPFDTSTITLPYNPQMENYLTSGMAQGKVVSVWYNQSINNGIVMQSGDWSI